LKTKKRGETEGERERERDGVQEGLLGSLLARAYENICALLGPPSCTNDH